MSDGPHKSLGMRKGWKKFAKRCDFSSYEDDQRAEAHVEALEDDWRAERCGPFIDEVRVVLNVGRQTDLFDTMKAWLEALKSVSGAGYPMRQTLRDNIEQAFERGASAHDAIIEGTANTLRDRSLRGIRNVEEHYQQKSTDRRAAKVRTHMEKSVAASSYNGLARAFLKIDGGSSPPPPKRDSLDEGVRL